MRTYVLFIFGDFNDHDEIVFFINEIFTKIPSVSELRYIMEDGKNLILVFDSDKSDEHITLDMFGNLNIEHVKYFFLFEKDGLKTAKLPKDFRDKVFKLAPKKEENYPQPENFDLDEILEKIEKQGIESLSSDEKKFLDNFGN